MAQHREKDPFIRKGDKIVIEAGPPGGSWDVMAARWAKRDDPTDERVEMVLGRGGGIGFKTIFNSRTMRHQSTCPRNMLARDIRVQKPLRFRPR